MVYDGFDCNYFTVTKFLGELQHIEHDNEVGKPQPDRPADGARVWGRIVMVKGLCMGRRVQI